MGIVMEQEKIQSIKDDYDGTEFDIQKLSEQLQNNDISLLKDIVTQLG